MTVKVFNFAIADNVLHLLAIWYLMTYVHDQPCWFYIACKVLIVCYFITSFITLLVFLFSNISHDDNPKSPRNS